MSAELTPERGAETIPTTDRRLTWGARAISWALTLATLICAVAFSIKLVKFSSTFFSDGTEMLGFAVIPVSNYLTVAAGFLLLLLWAFLKGQFSDIERAKYELLEEDAHWEAHEAHWRELERQGQY